VTELQIRPLRPEEWERAEQITAYAFGGRLPGERERESDEALPPEQEILGAFEDGALVSTATILKLAIWIDGARFSTGGLAGVATVPERVGRGYAQQLVRRAIAWMRGELGMCLSTLYPTVPPLYDRLGWTIAESAVRWSGPPTAFRPSPRLPRDPASQIVRRAAREDDIPLIQPIYQAFAQPRSGYLDRSDWWWKELLRRRPGQPSRWLATWAGAAGRLAGYVLYDLERGSERSVRVHDLIALTAEAYQGLLSFLATHHLWPKIVVPLGSDVPLPALVENFRLLAPEPSMGGQFMLRILDLPVAIGQRAVLAGSDSLSVVSPAVVMEVTDADAPWNAGNWRIGLREAAGRRHWICERTSQPAQARLDIRTVADLFGGYLRVPQAQALGFLTAAPEARPTLEALFHTTYAPTSVDHF
jgi:predicted acetyltransferase